MELARRGHQVTALDIAPAALEHLGERLQSEGLAANLAQVDVLQWQPEQLHDAVFEQTCLCALHPDHWETYSEQLSSWLKPGGTLAVSFMQTHQDGGPPWHCDLERMKELFPTEQWQWPGEGGLKVPHRNERYELAFQLLKR